MVFPREQICDKIKSNPILQTMLDVPAVEHYSTICMDRQDKMTLTKPIMGTPEEFKIPLAEEVQCPTGTIKFGDVHSHTASLYRYDDDVDYFSGLSDIDLFASSPYKVRCVVNVGTKKLTCYTPYTKQQLKSALDETEDYVFISSRQKNQLTADMLTKKIRLCSVPL